MQALKSHFRVWHTFFIADEGRSRPNIISGTQQDRLAERQQTGVEAEWLEDRGKLKLLNIVDHLGIVETGVMAAVSIGVTRDRVDLQVDLNRDFPDPIERGKAGVVEPSGSEQPETLALMQWIREGRFVVSASLHEVRG